ncbi:MAG TPA: hypothetical protein VFU98_10695 [Microlunatus sp.]|nr:hypothetical protein [Microlunatus sp.]
MASTPHTAVPAWTTTGHQLTWVGSAVDRREEQLVDDVIPDEWIHPPRRSTEPTAAPAAARADRPTDAVLL